ncbi:MAG TPA: DUF4864 domain-containing protein [Myxococcales bacterium LLY-WYZ-16_1]|nr:DUF4864 domain-containing protein [Myxococcales bacterium LLY-WYZ-16_1]
MLGHYLPDGGMGLVWIATAALMLGSGLDAEPEPDLSPRDVVGLQLDFLRQNPRLTNDAGIRAVYRFAAPSNRAATGPLPRFVRMVKGAAYAPMLGHRSARLGPMQVQGNQVALPVYLESSSGEPAGYLWVLERQTTKPHVDCWMTIAVMALDPKEARARIEAGST